MAYLLWLLRGFDVLSLNRFYVGKVFTGLLWLLTFGLLGLGAVLDLLLIPGLVEWANLKWMAWGGNRNTNANVITVKVTNGGGRDDRGGRRWSRPRMRREYDSDGGGQGRPSSRPRWCRRKGSRRSWAAGGRRRRLASAWSPIT